MNDIEKDICQFFRVKPRDGEPPEAATASSEPPAGVAVSATVAEELARAVAHVAEWCGVAPAEVMNDITVLSLCGAAEALGLDEARAVLTDAFHGKTTLINGPNGWRVFAQTEATPDGSAD